MSDSDEVPEASTNNDDKKKSKTPSPEPQQNVFDDEVGDYFERMVVVSDNLDYDCDGRFYESGSDNDTDNYDDDYNFLYPKDAVFPPLKYCPITRCYVQVKKSDDNKTDDEKNEDATTSASAKNVEVKEEEKKEVTPSSDKKKKPKPKKEEEAAEEN